ncbi:MAG: hypothetical protein EBU18_06980 [Rhodobacteraceae bacterium]|jgi:TfoX/Sxy family transcriptional regulator of competence genes|nr:hypothetical protein [Paracoccaceae bacterium]
MAYDIGLAQILRDDLADVAGISEKKMFGGLCFLLYGNMLCGVHKDGMMYRVGKDHHDAALAIDGAHDMMFTGRKMSGFIDVDADAVDDDEKRKAWLGMAFDFVSNLPAK